ncbi:MAG TPA: hypothetical protein VNJ28_04670 [Candidatus Limnocylindrales bacterium]|nr:hypothetical protein [Candidatus Limnocylindrales bacterium]
MSWIAPIAVAKAVDVFATVATANVENTQQLLAAPGAGLRYRVWWFSVMTSAPGSAAPVVGIRDPSSGNVLLSVVGGAVPRQGTVVVPGGVPLGANQALELIDWAPSPSITYYVAVGYTVEVAT